jgi:nucleoside-diphosphate-sugar epimerase
MKHVDIAEYNSFETVKTNIVGLQNVVNAAADGDVERLVFTSRYNAVNPTNTRERPSFWARNSSPPETSTVGEITSVWRQFDLATSSTPRSRSSRSSIARFARAVQ